MYVTTGFLKRGVSWHTNRALWYALAAPVPAPVLTQPRWIQAGAAAFLLDVLAYVIGNGAGARPLPTLAIRAGP